MKPRFVDGSAPIGSRGIGTRRAGCPNSMTSPMGSRVRQEAGMPHLQGTTQISNGRSWPWLLITISLAGCSSTPGVVGSTGSVSGYAVTDVSSTTMPPYTDEELQAAARVRQKPGILFLLLSLKQVRAKTSSAPHRRPRRRRTGPLRRPS